jgi:hypothetical protein
MQKSHLVLVSGAIVVAAFAWRANSSGAEKHVGDQQAQIDHLKSELRELKDSAGVANSRTELQVVDLAAAVRAGASPSRPEVPPLKEAAEPPTAPELSPEEERAANEAYIAKLRDSMESQFATEKTDPKWSGTATAEIRNKALPGLAGTSRLRSLECRESVCRLETSHQDNRTFQEFITKSLSSPEFGWEGPMLFAPVRTEASGEIVTVAFLSRAGSTPAYIDETP